MQFSKSQEPMHTKVLGYTQLVCGTAKIFYTCSDQTPLHQRCPEEHCLRAYMFVQDENASLNESIEASPAGWFMNEENLETVADAVGPDMFY